MRILHLIGTELDWADAVALAAEQSARIEVVVLAQEGSPAALSAAARGLLVVSLRRQQPVSCLAEAVALLQPDLVHLHGALASEAAMPLRVFSNRPIALQVQRQDTDGEGRLHRRVRGVQLDWRGRHGVAVIARSDVVAQHALVRSACPAGVSELIAVDGSAVTASWCINLYSRLLVAGQQAEQDAVLPGLA